MAANVPKYVCDLLAKTASGEMSMPDARKRMREWYAALPQKEKDVIAGTRMENGRTLSQAAEAIAQELIMISMPAQQT